MKRNMKFVIMNTKGFVPDKDTGKVIMHNTAQEAMQCMTPGDQLIPMKDEEQLTDHQSGKLRMPSLNRANAR